MEIAYAEGLEAVTMQRVARSFGFTTMALYRYVSSKSDLHQLMLDASLGDEQWVIDGDDWRVGLEQWARTIAQARSEEHTSELQSRGHLVCRLLLEKKIKIQKLEEYEKKHSNKY